MHSRGRRTSLGEHTGGVGVGGGVTLARGVGLGVAVTHAADVNRVRHVGRVLVGVAVGVLVGVCVGV
jgi:hypothetical protein